MAPTTNRYILDWIDAMAARTRPDKIVWITGDEDQLDQLRAEACATGEMTKLNEEKLPGCYLDRKSVV